MQGKGIIKEVRKESMREKQVGEERKIEREAR